MSSPADSDPHEAIMGVSSVLVTIVIPCLVVLCLDDACMARWSRFFNPCRRHDSESDGDFTVMVQFTKYFKSRGMKLMEISHSQSVEAKGGRREGDEQKSVATINRQMSRHLSTKSDKNTLSLKTFSALISGDFVLAHFGSLT